MEQPNNYRTSNPANC